MSTDLQSQRIGISPGSPQWVAVASSPYSSAIVGLIAGIVAWRTGLNANVLYITFLTTVYALFQFIINSARTRLILQGLLLFFLLYTPNPKPTMPKVVQSVNATEKFRIIPPGGFRDYRFMLQGIRDRASQCGTMPVGELYIQGTQLAGASLRGANIRITQQKVNPFYLVYGPPAPFFELRAVIEFPAGIPAKLDISLANTKAAPMTVKYGPEISGQTVYDEAVYMIFRTDKCIIVTHSKPASAAQ